jgi:hypothetical protein
MREEMVVTGAHDILRTSLSTGMDPVETAVTVRMIP